ncbi:MAG: lipopolysaccharide biosynthesis protein [Acidisphaera sp.]|nr:lipopolysaccharide biosynthesis protein [Acidisphaera sp.]
MSLAALRERLPRGVRAPLRYALSLAEQGCASILNLGLNLWLIREVGAAEYGVFVLWTNISLMLGSVQNALSLCHLLALPPGEEHAPARREPERLLLGVSLIMIALTAIGGVATALLADGRDGELVPWEVASFLPAVLIYAYARALAFSRGAVSMAFVLTASVLGTGLVLFALSYAAGIRPDAGWTLLILTGAYGMAGGAGLIRLSAGIRPMLRPAELRPYLQYLAQSRWVLLGVGATELLMRFYSFIVIAWFGTAALGVLSAAQVMLRPAVLAVTSWGWVARSEMAASREREEWGGFLRSLGRGLVGTLLISLPWAICVWLAWPVISARLYGGRYADAGWIALLWGGSAALGGVLGALSIGLQSLRAFRPLALADLAGSLVSVAATLLLLSRFSYPMSIVGMMIGQALEVVLLASTLGRLVPYAKTSGKGSALDPPLEPVAAQRTPDAITRLERRQRAKSTT